MVPVKPFRGRCWLRPTPKKLYATIAAASAEAIRLQQANRQRGIHPGRLCVYYCPIHCNFHVGTLREENAYDRPSH